MIFENLVDMFERSAKAYGPREVFGTKKNGQWVWTTFAEMGKLVDDFRGGLASLGVGAVAQAPTKVMAVTASSI